ncbi:hypothetical protein FOT55_21705 [Serratia bockelmannii]|nr:hypothetical protein FOT55_21705 [Serratia bockelmannii]
MVVILVVLTASQFRFSLFISQLLAKAIPVRGAIFREARSGKPERAFCCWAVILNYPLRSLYPTPFSHPLNG